MKIRKSSLNTPTSSPRVKKNMVRATCKTCSKNFFSYQMLPGANFCSARCLTKPYGKKVYCSPKSLIKKTFDTLKKNKSMKALVPSSRKCTQCSCLIPRARESSSYCSRACKNAYNLLPKKQNLVKIDLWSEENRDRWAALRYEVFKKYDRRCMICGASDRLHVDHIKPKSKYPDLAFDINNLQILCKDCNYGKSNVYEDDWRPR